MQSTVGKGTAFTIMLPVARRDRTPPHRKPSWVCPRHLPADQPPPAATPGSDTGARPEARHCQLAAMTTPSRPRSSVRIRCSSVMSRPTGIQPRVAGPNEHRSRDAPECHRAAAPRR